MVKKYILISLWNRLNYNLMNRITDTVKHLIIINVLLFLIPKAYPPIQDLFALHFPENSDFGFWQYLTSMFMHSQTGFMHIAFNMLGLWMFGSPLEQLWGRNKFIFFYFSAGIGAGIIYTLANYYQFNTIHNELINLGIQNSDIKSLLTTGSYNTNILNLISEERLTKFFHLYNGSAVGASGALYGILVAFGMNFPNTKLMMIFFPVPVAAKYFIPLLILGDVFFGFSSYSVGNIAHFAHIGGALIGFIIMMYWKNNQFKRWDK